MLEKENIGCQPCLNETRALTPLNEDAGYKHNTRIEKTKLGQGNIYKLTIDVAPKQYPYFF